MYTLIASIVLALIIGACLYGKKFWEKRINFLGLAGIIMFVSLLTTTLFIRHTLPAKGTVVGGYQIESMYLSNEYIIDTSFAIMHNQCSLEDEDIQKVIKPSVIRDTIVTDTNVVIKYRYADQRKSTYVLYTNSKNDTLIGLIIVNDSNLETYARKITDYLRIAPISKTDIDSKPRVERVDVEFADNLKWVISFMIPRYDSYYVIYLPEKDYLTLPEWIRTKCYYPGIDQYIATL